MQNITIKSSVYLLVGISALAWLSFAYFGELDLSQIKDFLGLVPKVVTVDLLLIAIFVKWGWKLKCFRGWLVPFPNLNGTWTGEIHSLWEDPKTGQRPPPIPAMLTINQSFFHISCVMHTGEMRSYSYSEGFMIDPDRQIKQLAYSYASKPRLSVSKRSVPHDGTGVLQIIEKPNFKLVGRYWTERLTIGEIALEFFTKDILDEIPDSLGEHPVTEPENKR
ncbi:hypothetical protein R6233_001459 [Vibrio parahaemolyticus]|nr:hypothetical protein [Vibrio parahaemolyticus]EJU8945849.1 hypothetical protein [Vibrio parahaemolyticus]ELS9501823.1 hypothetical protein [Vibrio parahaemolyticus]